MSGITQINADLPYHLTETLNLMYGEAALKLVNDNSEKYWAVTWVRDAFIAKSHSSLPLSLICEITGLQSAHHEAIKTALSGLVRANILRRRSIKGVAHWEVNYK